MSLLVDLKYEDLQKLQAVGASAQAEQAKLILRNDLEQVWEYLKGVKGGRVDIVLDNGQSLPDGSSDVFVTDKAIAGFEVCVHLHLVPG